MTRIISVHSFRGGTGKSNTTANLAALMAAEGMRAGIVDTDIQSPGLHVLFGLRGDDVTRSLNDFLWGKASIAETARRVDENRLSGALYLVPASIKADEIVQVLRQGYDMKLLTQAFRQISQELKLDALLIDTHPGLNEETLFSRAISSAVGERPASRPAGLRGHGRDDRRACLEAGVNDYLSKPVQRELLAAAMDRAVAATEGPLVSESEVVDRAVLDRLIEDAGDDPAFVRDLITTFLASAPALLEGTLEAAKKWRRRRAATGAHTEVERGNARRPGARRRRPRRRADGGRGPAARGGRPGAARTASDRGDRGARPPASRGCDAVSATAARILVVDDGEMTRQILVRLLGREGHAVLTAEHGLEAMERLRDPDAAVDVVLLDLLMPEMDGFEVLANVKGDPDLRHIPVIMVSAVEEIESVIRCIEAGAADYLTKPFNRAILRARIVASLAEKRARDREIEYLEQVRVVIDAAAALEAGEFDAQALVSVAEREDELGRLGRVFSRMAREVQEREQRLAGQLKELSVRVDQAETRRRAAEITGSDYFRELRDRAEELRDLIVTEDAR